MQTGYFYKNTLIDWSIYLCIPWDSCHEFFCIFKDFYASGTIHCLLKPKVFSSLDSGNSIRTQDTYLCFMVNTVIFLLNQVSLSVIEFGYSSDCLPTTEGYLSLMTRASYVRSPWMTCQWEGQLMRFCVWFKLFNLQINMAKVGSCQHFCVSVLIIYGNTLSFCWMLSYNTCHISWNSTDIFCRPAPSMLVFANWHHGSKKFNTGRVRGAHCFVAVIWVLHQVSQLNVKRIVAGFCGNFSGKKMREIILTLVFCNFNCFQTILHQTTSSLFRGSKKNWISAFTFCLPMFSDQHQISPCYINAL